MRIDIQHIEKRTERLFRMKYHSGRPHRWKPINEPLNLFYDGKVSGAMRLQMMLCNECGLTTTRQALEIARKP